MTDRPTIRQRFREQDSYGLLLVVLVATLFASALPFGTFGSFIRSLLIGLGLLFALMTSGVTRKELIAAVIVIVVALALSLPFEHDTRNDRIVVSTAQLVLAVGVLAAIARRVGTHPVVSAATVLAALSAYLVIGLAFAAAYGLVGAIDLGPAFAGTHAVGGDGTTLERTYFSFVTLTTVGFGDLTPATDVMRMLAITEAFTGQLYLVTVVALFVGNVGRERRLHREARSPDGTDAG